MERPSKRCSMEQLSQLFALCFGVASDPCYVAGARFVDTLRQSGMPLFWETSTPPAQHADEWGPHWDSVRSAWLPISSTGKLLDNGHFDWAKSPALEAFETELVARGRTPLELWASPDNRENRDKIPDKSTWDTDWHSIAPAVFGGEAVASGAAFVVPAPTTRYWKFWVGTRCDLARTQLMRGESRLARWRTELDRGVQNALADPRSFFQAFREYLAALTWAPLTRLDEDALSCAVPEGGFSIWVSKLTRQAQSAEFAFRSLGAGMCRLTGARLEVPEMVPWAAAAYLRGRDGDNDKSGGTTSHDDFLVFRDELAALADEITGRTHPIGSQTVVDVLDGNLWREPWDNAGDIGTDGYQQPRLKLAADLPGGQLPSGFRRHVAPDAVLYLDDDVQCIGAPLVLAYHQLQAVRICIDRMMNQSPVEGKWTGNQKAARALLQCWGDCPGLVLADDVGLGKTLTAIAIILAIVDLHHCPDNGARQWGGLSSGVPNAPHLIVCPPSLLDHWRSELGRFLKPSQFDIIVVSGESDMDKASTRYPIHQIWLTTTTVVTRMAEDALKPGSQSRRAAVWAPMAANRSLFGRSFGVGVIDEAHLLRTMGDTFRALDAMMTLCLLKLCMTPTPLVEGPLDLVALAQLIRASQMGAYQEAQLLDQVSSIQRQKKLLRQQTQDAALDFVSASMTDAPTSSAAENSPLVQFDHRTGEIVSTLHQILMPHTIRRTSSSLDDQQQPISQGLPPFTFVHLCFEVSVDERERAAIVEEPITEDGGELRPAGTAALYSASKVHLALPSGQRIAPLTCESCTDERFSKLFVLLELLRKIILDGPDSVVPAKYRGSTTAILDQQELGIPEVLIFTVLAQFHERMAEFLNSCGIQTSHVNGHMSPQERHQRITHFNHSPELPVLLMSGVGAAEQNLTNTSVVILYELPWSSFLTQEACARINRKGQKHSTLAIQLIASNTVEVLQATIALGKGKMASRFLQDTEKKRLMTVALRDMACTDANNAEESQADPTLCNSVPIPIQPAIQAGLKGRKGPHSKSRKKAPSPPRKRRPVRLVTPPPQVPLKADSSTSDSDSSNSPPPPPPHIDKGKGRAVNSRTLSPAAEDMPIDPEGAAVQLTIQLSLAQRGAAPQATTTIPPAITASQSSAFDFLGAHVETPQIGAPLPIFPPALSAAGPSWLLPPPASSGGDEPDPNSDAGQREEDEGPPQSLEEVGTMLHDEQPADHDSDDDDPTRAESTDDGVDVVAMISDSDSQENDDEDMPLSPRANPPVHTFSPYESPSPERPSKRGAKRPRANSDSEDDMAGTSAEQQKVAPGRGDANPTDVLSVDSLGVYFDSGDEKMLSRSPSLRPPSPRGPPAPTTSAPRTPRSHHQLQHHRYHEETTYLDDDINTDTGYDSEATRLRSQPSRSPSHRPPPPRGSPAPSTPAPRTPRSHHQPKHRRYQLDEEERRGGISPAQWTVPYPSLKPMKKNKR
ncbi:SNF2 family N-terminal domain-containing protein [Mycena rosella]|uniref:SNF2 family N-terminal domain-containing protein n=1 Tax=Mycena rosella TaxID=1033263 RepID=A0AAD7MD65_MYCRO|nr:SNF2 family N-terminal domain-containing protein [Mycena rosella]